MKVGIQDEPFGGALRFPSEEVLQPMKTFAATMLILCAAALIAMATGIDGKWATEMDMNAADGRSFTNKSTFVLKNEGGVLTGRVETNGGSVELTDGKVDGNKFTFTTKFEGKKGVKTITYEGNVEDEHLKGVLKVRGIGQT